MPKNYKTQNSKTKDSENNVYVTGQYQSTNPIPLGNGLQLLPTPSGVSNSYIIKYNSKGIVQWAKTIQAGCVGITIDSCNNVLVTGKYESTVPIDLGNGFTLPVSVNSNVFVIKYNSLGNVLWATTIQSNQISYGQSITIDSCNNVLVTGFYRSKILVNLGNGITLPVSTSTSTNGGNSFTIKYNSHGLCAWAKTIQADTYSYENGIGVDSCNNVIVTGNYISTVPIDLGNGIILPSSTIKRPFTIKYNSFGNTQWVNIIKADMSSNSNGITIDSCNNIIITGYYRSTIPVQFGNGITLNPSTINKGIIIKYNPQGNIQWVNTIQANQNSIGKSITTDSCNNLIITGQYQSTDPVLLGNGIILTPSIGSTIYQGSSTGDAFIIKYNPQSNVQWAKTIQANKYSYGWSIITDSCNNIIVTGQYQSTSITQLGNGSVLVPSIGTGTGTDPNTNEYKPPGDAFTIKYNTTGVVQWNTTIKATNFSIGYSIT